MNDYEGALMCSVRNKDCDIHTIAEENLKLLDGRKNNE
jgi:hypothetical protein